MDLHQSARTVAVTARSQLSMELLARTSELPDSKRELVALLAEYRHALAT